MSADFFFPPIYRATCRTVAVVVVVVVVVVVAIYYRGRRRRRFFFDDKNVFLRSKRVPKDGFQDFLVLPSTAFHPNRNLPVSSDRKTFCDFVFCSNERYEIFTRFIVFIDRRSCS